MEVYVKAEDTSAGANVDFYYEGTKLVKVKFAYAGAEEHDFHCFRNHEGRLVAVQGNHPVIQPAEMVVTFEYDKKGKIAESKTPLEARVHTIFFSLVFGYYNDRLSTFRSKIDPEHEGYFAYGRKPANKAGKDDKLSGVRWPRYLHRGDFVIKIGKNAPLDIDLNEVAVILALF